MTLTDSDKDLLLKAMCCVVAADGRVSGREITVIAEALTKAGCPTTPEQIRPAVIDLSKKIHATGASLYASRLVPQLSSGRSSNVAIVLRSTIDAVTKADAQVTKGESEIARIFLAAMEGALSLRNEPVVTRSRESIAAMFSQLSPLHKNLFAGGAICLTYLALSMIGRGVGTSNDAENKALRQRIDDLERAKQNAAQPAVAERASPQRAATEQTAANASRMREDLLKTSANILANAVNENHYKTEKSSGKTVVNDLYNDLYTDIYTRLDAETTGLTGDDLGRKAHEVGREWMRKKMLGY